MWLKKLFGIKTVSTKQVKKEEMEIHLDHDIAEGDIIEILNFLETNLDCEIRFKSYFTDHYYQLKEV